MDGGGKKVNNLGGKERKNWEEMESSSEAVVASNPSFVSSVSSVSSNNGNGNGFNGKDVLVFYLFAHLQLRMYCV